jgi:hypothetical protein
VSPNRRDLLLGAAAASLVITRPAVAAPAGELERLLELERRLEAVYAAALERDAIDPALGARLLRHEREHVRGLQQALGRRGAGAPASAAGIDLDDRRAFARSALKLEREAVDAYEGVLPDLPNERLRQPLGSIMACGAQHEVALRQALGMDLLRRN